MYRAREAIDSQEADKMAALNKQAAEQAAKAAQDAANAAAATPPPTTPPDAGKGPDSPKRD